MHALLEWTVSQIALDICSDQVPVGQWQLKLHEMLLTCSHIWIVIVHLYHGLTSPANRIGKAFREKEILHVQ